MRPMLCSLLSCVTGLAQIGGDGRDGPLDPSASTTLYTTRPNGEFFFSRVWIPPGVRLTIEGPNPAILHVQGSVVIDGELVADGKSPPWDGCCAGAAGGPGGFAGGDGNVVFGGGLRVGQQGLGPGGGGATYCFSGPVPCLGEGGGGGHATPGRTGQLGGSPGQGGGTYGSALPFDVQGGSGGGGGISEPQLGIRYYSGAGGGGVLIVLADGPILVQGVVSARGGDVSAANVYPLLFGGGGSGGSILLRSLTGVSVAATGSVLATGGHRLYAGRSDWGPSGGDGFVRIDAYGIAPQLTGTVRPAGTVLSWPWLEPAAAPRLGQTWRTRAFSLPGDGFLVGLSLVTAVVPAPPFGTLLIDLSAALVLGPLDVPRGGVDPSAELAVDIPNDPQLAGLRFYAQGLNVVTAVQPRLTNRVDAVVVP